MKRMWKAIVLFTLFSVGILIALRQRMSHAPAMLTPRTAAPKRSLTEQWRSIKQTFPETASDMDSPEIIEERRKDIT